MNTTAHPLLRMEGITKTFPGVKALDRVDFDLVAGEVHALVGANGAGKSTLVNILAGVQPKDTGQIHLRGEQVEIDTPADAIALRISYVPQELLLVPTLGVAHNILLGREPLHGKAIPLIDERELRAQVREVLDRLGVEVALDTTVKDLPVSTQQMIAIAIAMSRQSEILIMDEPTASLTEKEISRLFEIIQQLRQEGQAIIYISHRLEEVFSVADRITILRDGVGQGTFGIGEVDLQEVVRLMVGHRMASRSLERQRAKDGPEAIAVHDLTVAGSLQNISFSVRHGEILGFFGQTGAGRTDVLRAVFGADRTDSGEISVGGQPVQINSPVDAINHGMGFLTEDRKGQGLVLSMSVADNITIGNWKAISRAGLIMLALRNEAAQRYTHELDIKAQNVDQWVKYLSGGNQQKVVLARWLSRNSRVLLLDEPTKGIDVGTKAEFYRLIRDLAAQGAAILLVSSELPEIMMLSDRVLVMKDGRITGEFVPDETTEEEILAHAL